MAEKREILQELGEENLLLPASINAALKANDRIKYFFTLLQAARNHADNPARAIRTSGRSVSRSALLIPISTRWSGGRPSQTGRVMPSRSWVQYLKR